MAKKYIVPSNLLGNTVWAKRKVELNDTTSQADLKYLHEEVGMQEIIVVEVPDVEKEAKKSSKK